MRTPKANISRPEAAGAVTIQSIATHLALSPATVSRSLRQDPLISAATRARVQEAAESLGYQGRSGRTGLIGDDPRVLGVFVSSNTPSRTHAASNFMRMLEGITAEADAAGVLTSLHTVVPSSSSKRTAGVDAVPAVLRENRSAAAIVAGDIDREDVELIARQMPVVTLSRIYEDVVTDAVVADNIQGMRALVTRLAELGHRRLAWVPDRYMASFFEARQAGFIQGCLHSGLDIAAQVFVGADIHDGQEWHTVSAGRLLAYLQLQRDGSHSENADPVTAVVCANDHIAFLVLAALHGAGIRVPDEISVTGFDQAPAPPQTEKMLTSVDPNFVEMGRGAVRLALQRLDRVTLPRLVLTIPGTPIPGETVGPRP